MIEVERLSKRFTQGSGRSARVVQAVDGVAFTAADGRITGLLGPNGAGKSTAIEILEGYRDRTSGEVSVLGVDPQRGGLSWKARLGEVARSQQSYLLDRALHDRADLKLTLRKQNLRCFQQPHRSHHVV